MIRALSRFESLILALVNAKLFQITLWKREKSFILDRDSHRKPDSRTCERKALFRNVIRACAFWKMRTEGMHGSISADCAVGTKLLRSAQILIMIGKAFAMHVNACSSNHDPNQVLDRDPKRLSERDSLSCEHSLRERGGGVNRNVIYCS